MNAMGKTKEQYIVDSKGKKTAVILPIGEYEELLEDLHDLSVIAERKDEPVISFNEIKKRLKKDGLL
jgi:PHD/YefM family antitoxin component YafN of YafNO toxin-antitoxin module